MTRAAPVPAPAVVPARTPPAARVPAAAGGRDDHRRGGWAAVPDFGFGRMAVHAPAPACKRSAKGGGVAAAAPAPAPVPAAPPPAAPAPAPAAPASAPCPPGPAYAAAKAVAPSHVVTRPAPKRSNTDPSTTQADNPTLTGHAATECAAGLWRYEPDAIESKGTIQLVFYTADHYPAPTPTDDSGALSNVTSANWHAVVNDLRTNKNGVPAFWSAYRREVLHEDYHWNTEWQGEVNKEVPKAHTAIAALSLPFAGAATAAAAEAVLAPQAKAAFDTAMRRARTAYNALGDSPGDPPYVAQAPAMEALANTVQAHATANKWP